MYTRCWSAWIIRTRTTNEALSRGCRHDRGLGVTTWGGYIFLFSFFFPFFSRFCFIGSALLDNGSWRHMETSLLFVSQSALPVRLAASPRSQSVDLSNRELGRSCGALNRTVCSKLRILRIEKIGRCSSRARERLWLLHNLRRSTPDNNSIYLERE